MTDRKYGQQGYRESADEGKGKSKGPYAPRTPELLTTRSVFRCVDCGTLLPSLSAPPDQCPTCRAAIHSCQQCTHFAPSRPFECTQTIPERISDKRARNECTFFLLRETVEREKSSGSRRPDDARTAAQNLFKK